MPAEPAMPRQSWLAAFMEEKHIRWGELVGGLLIVACSIALVVSFWSKIAERPFLKFGVLNGVTAALFGIGLYAARKWKLPTTSQGILLTSTLLVPLNFLAIAAFSEGSQQLTLPLLVGESLSTLLLGTLVYLAAKIITPSWTIPVTVGVVLPAVGQLVLRRHVTADASVGQLYGFVLSGLAVYVGTQFPIVWRKREDQPLNERQGNELLKQLGLVSFSLAVALGLLFVKADRSAEQWQWLAPLSLLMGIPALANGLILWKRPGSEEQSQSMVGTTLVVIAAVGAIAGLAWAWPQPILLASCAILGSLGLTFLAYRFDIDELHIPAAILNAGAATVLLLIARQKLSWTVDSPGLLVSALMSATAGRVMTLVAFAQLGAAWALSKLPGSIPAASYGIIGAVTAGVGLLLVTGYGWGVAGDPEYLTWLLAFYGLVAAGVAFFGRFAWVQAVAGLLLLGALGQGIVYGPWMIDLSPSALWLIALLLHATLMGVAAAAAWLTQRPATFAPSVVWSFGSSLAATLLIGARALFWNEPVSPGQVLWIGLIWLNLAWLLESRLLFSMFQAALALSLMVLVDHRLEGQSWYSAGDRGWLHPISLQWQGIVLAVYFLAWSVLRIFGVPRLTGIQEVDKRLRWEWWLRTVRSGWPSVDRIALVVAGMLLVLLAIHAVVPGIAQELSPRVGEQRVIPSPEAYQFMQLPHEPARGTLSWVLCLVVGLGFIVSLREEKGFGALAGMTMAASTIPLLVAAHWESDVAVASALRWTSAFFFLAASTLVWLRRPLVKFLRRWGVVSDDSRATAGQSFSLLLLLAAAPVLAMAFFVALAALSLTPPTGAQFDLLWWLGVLALSAIVAALMGRAWLPSESNGWQAVAGSLIILAVMPLFAMSCFVVGQSLAAHPVIGPNADSFFSEIGLAASYTIPLILIGVALIGHAISLRSEPLAFGAGLMLNFAGTAAYLLSLRVAGTLTLEQWVRLAQLNALIASVYGIGWLIFVRFRVVSHRPRWAPDGWRRTQLYVANGFFLLPVLAVVTAVFVSPNVMRNGTVAAGVWGWSALALVTAHAIAFFWFSGRAVSPILSQVLSYAFVILVALQVSAWPIAWLGGRWSTYHLLQMAMFVAGIAVIAWEAWEKNRSSQVFLGDRKFVDSASGDPVTTAAAAEIASDSREATDWLLGMLRLVPLAALVLFSLRSIPVDRQAHLWSVAGLGAAAVLSVQRRIATDRQRYNWLASALLNLGASFWYVLYGYKRIATGQEAVLSFIYWNTAILALPAPLWLALRRRDRDARRLGFRWPDLHNFVTFLAILLLGFAVGLGLATDVVGSSVVAPLGIVLLGLMAVLLAAGSCLWDPHRQWSVMFWYLTGLVATGLLLDRLNVPADAILWLSPLLLSAYGVATSYLWSRREGLQSALRQLGVPEATDSQIPSQKWLIPLNGMLAIVVCGLAVWVQFSCENLGLRVAVSQAAAAQALAMGLLARGRRETELRYAALLIGVVAAVCFGWAWLSPTAPHDQWLNRWVVLTVSLLGTAALYAVGLVKLWRRENAWTAAAQRLVPGLVGAGALSGLVVLGSEAMLFLQYGEAHMAWQGIVAVALALLAMTAASLVAAVVPGRDPFGLSEKRRTIYVYAAEAFIALLCFHLRVTVPELFSGVVQQYWTLIVMALAFLGVGLSEWFRRRHQEVLAEPLERTGILLPLLPVLAFWVVPQEVHYSVVLLAVGGLYAALSILRRSFGFGLLAVLAANGGLWYFLQKTAQISFLEHPQLWLVPLAACVLVAAYLNRRQLTAAQMTSIRYLTSSVIYTSSTADIFIHGVAEAPWLPMILAGFSLLGIFAGILFRVRAFLFLGLTFLVVSLLTVIWHAAVDLQQTWLWYVTGIIVGVLIIALFAVFERKRQEVLGLVEQLKSWEA